VSELFFHPSSPQKFGDTPFGDDFSEFGEDEQDCSDSAQDDEYSEYSAGGGEVMDFLEADRKDRDDGHVETVQQGPLFDDMEADDPDENHEQNE
jgi:hypothetical protein